MSIRPVVVHASLAGKLLSFYQGRHRDLFGSRYSHEDSTPAAIYRTSGVLFSHVHRLQ